MTEVKPKIAVLGGTGDLGGGLARQLIRNGYPIVIGSRSREKAAITADELAKSSDGGLDVTGLSNSAAAASAEVVILAVPFSSQMAVLESVVDSVQGKIFIDTTVPLVPPKVMRVQMPEGGSAGKIAQAFLGENVRVVSAFQNVAASHLNTDQPFLGDCDVLVTGNDKDAREFVVDLAAELGMNALHAGPIDNSVVAEALTSVLIFMNKRYQFKGAGIKITGGAASSTNHTS